MAELDPIAIRAQQIARARHQVYAAGLAALGTLALVFTKVTVPAIWPVGATLAAVLLAVWGMRRQAPPQEPRSARAERAGAMSGWEAARQAREAAKQAQALRELNAHPVPDGYGPPVHGTCRTCGQRVTNYPTTI